MSRGKRIAKLFEQEEWGEARELLLRELANDPSDHWLLTRLGTTYYEERQYAKALELAEQAHAIAPECPLVLWDLAGACLALGDGERARAIYQGILDRGFDDLAFGECGEGEEWARGLLADCADRLEKGVRP